MKPHNFPIRKSDHGFTLIELLIVIAIILILIAIALPNFLAAQVRAKVLRERADMKTLATAIESLRTERNLLLVDFWDDDNTAIRATRFGLNCSTPGSFLSSGPAPFFACCCWHQQDARGGTTGIFTPLTTPIDYLKTVPEDPFSFTGDTASLVPGDLDPPISYQYIDYELEDERIAGDNPAEPRGVFGCWRPANNCPPGLNGITFIKKDEYVLVGFGPDLERQPGYDLPYSPTNGTSSKGDNLYRSSQGLIQ